jgi:hypothetical protein
VTSGSDAADPRDRARRIVAEVLGRVDTPPATVEEPPTDQPTEPSAPTAPGAPARDHDKEDAEEPVRTESGRAAHRIVIDVLAAHGQGDGGSGTTPDPVPDAASAPPEPVGTWAQQLAHRIREEVVAEHAAPATQVEPARPAGPEDEGPAFEEEDAEGPPPIPATVLAAAAAAEPPVAPPDDAREPQHAPAGEEERAGSVDVADVDEANVADRSATWSDQDAAAIARDLVAQVTAGSRPPHEPAGAVQTGAAPADEVVAAPADQDEPVPAAADVPAPADPERDAVGVAPEVQMQRLFAAPSDDPDGADEQAPADDDAELIDGDTPWKLDGDLTPAGASSRRSGRWLLATILGAIAIALLFPLAVAALRQVLALS